MRTVAPSPGYGNEDLKTRCGNYPLQGSAPGHLDSSGCHKRGRWPGHVRRSCESAKSATPSSPPPASQTGTGVCPRKRWDKSEAQLAEPKGPMSSWARPSEKSREVETCLRLHSETWAGCVHSGRNNPNGPAVGTSIRPIPYGFRLMWRDLVENRSYTEWKKCQVLSRSAEKWGILPFG